MKKRILLLLLLLIAAAIWYLKFSGVTNEMIHSSLLDESAQIQSVVDDRFQKLSAKLDSIEENVHQRLTCFEQKVDRLDEKFGRVDQQLDRIEQKLDRLLRLANPPLPDNLKRASDSLGE